jgi:hypothetical protein
MKLSNNHKHGRESFGSVTAETSFGLSSSSGAASTVARSDHAHGTPAAPSIPSAASTVTDETTYGLSTAVGNSTNYARQDHTHGTVSHDAHASLTGITPNDHHNQAHSISGSDHTGTLAHSSLSSVTADQHHSQDHAGRHAHNGADSLGAYFQLGMSYPATVNGLYCTQNAAIVANRGYYILVTEGLVQSVSSLVIAVGVQSGNISVAAYDSTGTGRSRLPNNRLGTSGAVTCPAVGEATIPLANSVHVVPFETWFFISADNATAQFAKTAHVLCHPQQGTMGAPV